MNKSFDFRAKQSRHRSHSENRRAKDRAKMADAGYVYSQRKLIFAYKGIVIKKEGHVYELDREFKIKGMNPADIQGTWNDGALFKIFLDSLLEKADPERLAEVRACYRNWTCPKCKLTELFTEDLMFGAHIHCKYCGVYIDPSPFPEASDEVFR